MQQRRTGRRVESAVMKDHSMGKQTVTHHGIPFDRSAIEQFCLNNGIRKLSLFGSVLRDDFGPDSDIDVLVEFMPDARVGYFELFDIEEELSHLLGGRKVDLHTPNEISRYFRDRVLSEAELQYVQ